VTPDRLAELVARRGHRGRAHHLATFAGATDGPAIMIQKPS
jgi:hypothetical protein